MKKILNIIVICMMLAAIFLGLNQLVSNKVDSGCSQLTNFYQLEDDTVEVLFLGSSHVYKNINPCQLYDDYGIVSYALGSGAQPIWNSYYYLEEALKTQSPKVIVYDIYTLERADNKFDENVLNNLISMKPSLTKWKAIRAANFNHVVKDTDLFLSFPYMHTRYSDLSEQDFRNYSLQNYNGYMPLWGTVGQEKVEQLKLINPFDVYSISSLSKRSELYLRKLIERCQEEKILLVLVNSPWLGLTTEAQEKYNYVEQFAAEYGVPFLDTNKKIEDIGIVYGMDFADTSHLNYSGTQKYTAYLAKYLKENYQLLDCRGNERYVHWDTVSSQFYHKEVLKREFNSITDLEIYLKKLLKQDNMIVAVSLAGNWKTSEDKVSDIMKQFSKSWNGENVILIDDGEIVFSENVGGSTCQKHFDFEIVDFLIDWNETEISIILDAKSFACTKNGINIVVYDKTAGMVIDKLGIQIEKDMEISRKILE